MIRVTFASKLLEGWRPDDYDPVEEGLVGISYAVIGVLLVLGFVSYNHETKKSNKSISSTDKDILSHFTRIPTPELERKISDIVKEYPIMNIDEGVYNQFLSFKRLCSSKLKLAEVLMKKERVNLTEPIDFHKTLKPFRVPYSVQNGNIANISEIQSLDKFIKKVESEYKVSDETYLKYLKANIRKINGTVYQNVNKNAELLTPTFSKSGKMIQIKSSEILTDFLSSDVLHKLNDAYKYLEPWFSFCSDGEDGYDDFLQELFDSLENYEPYDEHNNLVYTHPYYKALDILSQKPKLVNMFLVNPLNSYCIAISKIAKYITL